MKKLFLGAIALVAMFIVTSCGGGANTPSEKALEMYGYIQDGDFDSYVDGIYFKESDRKDEKKMSEFKSMISEKGKQTLEKCEGIKDVEVLEEVISEDGKSATVKVKLTFGNGDDDTKSDKFILDENGEWKSKIK